MDANFGVVTETFYQILEICVSQRYVFIVQVIFSAKYEIQWMQIQFFLQLKLIVESVKRVVRLSENNSPSLFKLLKIKV